MDLINADCLEYLPKIKEGTVDLILLDLPYGQTACRWDCEIDLKKMWVEIKRIIKPTGIVIFFCTTKFGYKLIESNPRWFRYDLVWKKSRKVGFLSANKMPLRQHEMIYVFKPKQGTYNAQKTAGHKLRDRSENKRGVVDTVYGEKIDISKGKNTTDERHPTSVIGEFEETPLPSEVEGEFIPAYMEVEGCHEMVYVFKPKQGTYNPQKTTGHKEYTHGPRPKKIEIYNAPSIETSENKTERYPSTILEFNNPHKVLHKTQKPVDLCEWLIKSYSNENEVVLDFCMGSGTVGEACRNTNRKFIGVEKDPEIFKIAKERLKKYKIFH